MEENTHAQNSVSENEEEAVEQVEEVVEEIASEAENLDMPVPEARSAEEFTSQVDSLPEEVPAKRGFLARLFGR